MAQDEHHPPGLATLARRLAVTGLGAVQNRCELLAVEWQQAKARGIALLVFALACVFLAMMAIGLLTAIIIFVCPQDARLYVAAGFTLLYLAGAVWTGLVLKTLLKQVPFEESLNQFKKDREWLDSFK